MSYMPPEKPFKRAHVTATPQRTGLDDGPPLPSLAARERAVKRILMRDRWISYIKGECGKNGGAVKIAA